MRLLKPVPFTILFWAICAIVFWLNEGNRILHLRPQSVHVWRQTDCTSYTLNYYQNNQPFFEPQTHTLTGKNGHTVSEFPVLYFLTAKLYDVFGPKEAILRAINFILFLFGCTCVLWIGLELFEHKWMAIFPALLTYTSPYLYYYALNFLPDVPALSLSLGGTFLVVKYYRQPKVIWLIMAGLLFAFATLLKISAGIPLVAITIVFSLSLFTRKPLLINRKHTITALSVLATVSLLNISWVLFAKYYNTENGTGQNLLGLYPIWDANRGEIQYILYRLVAEWSAVILHPLVWTVTGIFLCLIVWRAKTLPPFILSTTGFCIAGALLYSIFWFRAYMDHDYYMINPFVAIIWIWLAGLWLVDKQTTILRIGATSLLLIAVVIAIFHCRQVQITRYSSANFKYFNEAYFTIEPYLRSIGISRKDKVVSVPDVSPNITLYFLNQPGWTEAFNHEEYNVNFFVNQGAKYLVIGDSAYLSNPLYVPHIGNKIGEYNGIQIFTVK